MKTNFITLLMLSAITLISSYAVAKSETLPLTSYSSMDKTLIDSEPVLSLANAKRYMPALLGAIIIPSVFTALLPWSPVAAVLIGVPLEIGVIHYALVNSLLVNEEGKITALTAITALASNACLTKIAVSAALTAFTARHVVAVQADICCDGG